jgi:hypothetical protein
MDCEDNYTSLVEQAKRETDIENKSLDIPSKIRLHHHNWIAIGGGTPLTAQQVATGVTLAPQEFG